MSGLQPPSQNAYGRETRLQLVQQGEVAGDCKRIRRGDCSVRHCVDDVGLLSAKAPLDCTAGMEEAV
jgi:hypothetical protein